MRLLSRLFGKKNKPWDDNLDIGQRQQQTEKMKLRRDLRGNLDTLTKLCGHSADVRIRRFRFGGQIDAAVVTIDGMVANSAVEEILKALMIESRDTGPLPRGGRDLAAAVEDLVVVSSAQWSDSFGELFGRMAIGDTVVLLDGCSEALACETTGWQTRHITEPNAEITVRGPREGFVESIMVNTSLIRRRIRVPHLWVEHLEIGSLTQTSVAMVYIKGLVREGVLEELRDRLGRIDIDGVLESGYVEDFITDQPFTIFPLLLRTERPDVVCSSLLEGRVAVLVNGSPHALVLPAELSMFVQAPDDYYEKVPIGSFVRILRWMSVIIATFLPAAYVAIINFHQELLPTALLLRIVATREGVPFPVIAEVLIMDLLFEILREAGIRLPAAIGPAISIVGALVLGEAAISAGLVSPAVVIVIALTAIASFAIPIFSVAIAFRLLRFFFLFLGAAFGLFGLQFGLLLIIIHLCSLRSFGVPYMAPLGPLIMRDMKDNFVRLWWWAQRTRPTLVGRDDVRQPRGQGPALPPFRKSQETGDRK
ncbi:MAG: spore germination protein [Bacillota bacterium]